MTSVTSINFFLGIEKKMSDDAAEDVAEASQIEIDEHRHSKKTAGRRNQV